MSDEPSLSQVHADLRAHLKLDERVRGVEIRQASLDTGMEALRAEVREMKVDLLTAIKENTPKSPWPAVASLAAVFAVFLTLAAAIYAR